MLLEFTCSNFMSIYKKIKLSMLATADDSMREELIAFDKYFVSRKSVLYGPNGSGKTTVLAAILYARDMVCSSMKMEPGDALRVVAHKLAETDEATEFTFQYVSHGIRYAYGFSVLKGAIDEEYLYYFPNRRQTKIFTRKQLHVEGGDSFRRFPETALEALKSNRLFLSCATNYSNSAEIENAFLFFKSELTAFGTVDSNMGLKSAIQYMNNHQELKDIYLKIVNYLGTGIREFRTYCEKRKVNMDGMPEAFRSMLAGREEFISEATIYYDGFSTDLLTEESTGIQKMFAFLYPYLETLQKGNVLVCDEIENGLHESIVRGILELFTQLYPESNAQIIFTTHDTSLLDSDLFRRDQIWFTELDDMRSTDLYSLAEIKNVRKTENLKRGYVSGKYGAIPMLNPNLYTDIIAESKAEYGGKVISDKEDFYGNKS